MREILWVMTLFYNLIMVLVTSLSKFVRFKELYIHGKGMHFTLCKLYFSLKNVCWFGGWVMCSINLYTFTRSSSLSPLWLPPLLLPSFLLTFQLPGFPCCFLSVLELSVNVALHMCATQLGAASLPLTALESLLPSLSVADDQASLRPHLREHLVDGFRLTVCLTHW